MRRKKKLLAFIVCIAMVGLITGYGTVAWCNTVTGTAGITKELSCVSDDTNEKLKEVTVSINGNACDFYSTTFGNVFKGDFDSLELRNVADETFLYDMDDIVDESFYGYLGDDFNKYFIFINNTSGNNIPISECSVQHLSFGVDCPFDVNISGGIKIGMPYDMVKDIIEPEYEHNGNGTTGKLVQIPLSTGYGRKLILIFDSEEHISKMSIG